VLKRPDWFEAFLFLFLGFGVEGLLWVWCVYPFLVVAQVFGFGLTAKLFRLRRVT
jgi:hypothetical protein